MKIYIASHSKEESLALADKLRGRHEIVSRWIYGDFGPTASYSDTDKARIAEEDVLDVLSCDCLVLIAGNEKYTGGKFVELGIAMGARKRVIVMGRRENMLIWHPDIIIADSPLAVEHLTRQKTGE